MIEDALKDDKKDDKFPDIPAYKLAFVKAVGELFIQSITTEPKTLQLPSKKGNPFLPSAEEKSVVPAGDLSKEDRMIVEKSKTVLSDVQLLLHRLGHLGHPLVRGVGSRRRQGQSHRQHRRQQGARSPFHLVSSFAQIFLPG